VRTIFARRRGHRWHATRVDGGPRICPPSRTTSAWSPTLKGAAEERSCKTTARSDGNDLAAIDSILRGSRAVHRCRRCRPARPRIFELPVSGSQRRLALDQLLLSFLASLPPSWPISLAGRHFALNWSVSHAPSSGTCPKQLARAAAVFAVPFQPQLRPAAIRQCQAVKPEAVQIPSLPSPCCMGTWHSFLIFGSLSCRTSGRARLAL
jgi:hypothetical protein